MDNFTKGPWIAQKDGVTRDLDGYRSVYIIKTQNTNRQEKEANAKLIAAAPELLQALESALIAVENGCETEADKHGLVDVIKTALKKAKGVTNG